VKLSSPVNAYSAAKIFQEVVKFMLYFQNQCPGPYDEVLQRVQMLEEEEVEDFASVGPAMIGRRKRRRRTATERRLCKFVHGVEALFKLVDAPFLAASRGTETLVVLGASPARPKMACLLEWCPSHEALQLPPCEADAQAKKDAANGARRVIRALIQSALDTKIATGPSKLFVLSRGPVEDAPSPHFLPKRSFQPQWRKGKQTVQPIRIKLHSAGAVALQEAGGEGDGTALGSVAAQQPLGSTQESIWYQCSCSLRDLPAVACAV